MSEPALDVTDVSTSRFVQQHRIQPNDGLPGLMQFIWGMLTTTLASALYTLAAILGFYNKDQLNDLDPSICKICGPAPQGEALETLHDSLSPIYDQMNRGLLWRGESTCSPAPASAYVSCPEVMEYVPFQTKTQKDVVLENNKYIWT
jgi:hypothetical protein